MKDEYGFQPEEAKAKLRAIIALSQAERKVEVSAADAKAALREAHAAGRLQYEQDQAEMLERARENALKPVEEPVALVEPEPEPIVAVPNDEPTFTTHPELFIAIHRAEMVQYTEHQGVGRPDIVRWVQTGRTLTSYRLRTPADGDAEFLREAAYVPEPPAPKKRESFKWFDPMNTTARRATHGEIASNRSRHQSEGIKRLGQGSRMPSGKFAS